MSILSSTVTNCSSLVQLRLNYHRLLFWLSERCYKSYMSTDKYNTHVCTCSAVDDKLSTCTGHSNINVNYSSTHDQRRAMLSWGLDLSRFGLCNVHEDYCISSSIGKKLKLKYLTATAFENKTNKQETIYT